MADILLSSQVLLERLAREEQQMKFLGLHGHAAGVRAAITIMLRIGQEPAGQVQPLEPSSEASDGG